MKYLQWAAHGLALLTVGFSVVSLAGQVPGSLQSPAAGPPVLERPAQEEELPAFSFTMAEAKKVFQDAAAAYEKGDFDAAAVRYGRLVEARLADAVVHYNLGNAYYRLGRTGDAILAFERARFLDPADPQIRENLEFVSSRIVDRVGDVSTVDGPLRTLWEWHERLPTAAATFMFLASWVLFNLCLGVALLSRRRHRRRLGAYALSGALVILLLAGSVLSLQVYRRDTVVHGIVLTTRLDLQSVPGGGIKLTTIHEGLKLRIRGIRGEWLEVMLPNGLRGWVPADQVGIV